MKKSVLRIFIVSFIVIILIYVYSSFNKQNDVNKTSVETTNESSTQVNIIKDVNYSARDARGNEYLIYAEEGQIDISSDEIIYLTNVKASINIDQSKNIKIASNFGKYNINNFDTIFSKNVIMEYLDNKITGDYLDFSLERKSMIISKNVVYENSENLLKTDVIEINIETKDTKIFMYEKEKKVNISSKN